MGRFTKIPSTTFDELQLDAGVLLNSFDPNNISDPEDSDILCATKGGISISAVPKWQDMGEDVDNCPQGTKELKKLVGWNCTVSFNSVTFSPNMLKLGLGAADVDGQAVTLRRDVKLSDFGDIWWVGDMSGGGMAAVKLMNSLSTSGLAITTTKDGKGQMAMTLQGHISIDRLDVVPMEFYVASGNRSE